MIRKDIYMIKICRSVIKNGIHVIRKHIRNSIEQAQLGGPHSGILTTDLIRCLRIRWGGQRTFEFGTFGQIFKQGWGHRTFQLRLSGQIFKLRWGHRTRFKPSKLRWRVGGFPIGNNTTSWLHLASWNLLESQPC